MGRYLILDQNRVASPFLTGVECPFESGGVVHESGLAAEA
jgi:hypothetical protein